MMLFLFTSRLLLTSFLFYKRSVVVYLFPYVQVVCCCLPPLSFIIVVQNSVQIQSNSKFLFFLTITWLSMHVSVPNSFDLCPQFWWQQPKSSVAVVFRNIFSNMTSFQREIFHRKIVLVLTKYSVSFQTIIKHCFHPCQSCIILLTCALNFINTCGMVYIFHYHH